MGAKFWYWFGIAVCPLIVVGALFQLGSSMGRLIYSNGEMTPTFFDFIVIALGMSAAFEFTRALRVRMTATLNRSVEQRNVKQGKAD